MVTYKTWSRLIRLAHPGKTKHQIDLLMMVLDTDRTGYISKTYSYAYFFVKSLSGTQKCMLSISKTKHRSSVGRASSMDCITYN